METTQITYDPNELQTIVEVLREYTQPEEILLFGALAGAVPFSQIAAYDLLVLTTNHTSAQWDDMRCCLKLRLPARSRIIPSINLYPFSPDEVSLQMSLFYRFVRHQCKPLYSRTASKISNKKYNYETFRTEASDRAQLFLRQAETFLRAAEQSTEDSRWRVTAFQTACAAEMLLQALYAAYHGTHSDEHKLTTLFLRMRTLSAELLLLLDPERHSTSRMLSGLDLFRTKTIYRLEHNPDTSELSEYLARVHKMQHLIEKLVRQRIKIYEDQK